MTRVLLLDCRVKDMPARTEEACQSQLMSVNSLNRLEDVKTFSREFFIIYT